MRSLLSYVRLAALCALCTALAVGCKKEEEPQDDPTAEAAEGEEPEEEAAGEGETAEKAQKAQKGDKGKADKASKKKREKASEGSEGVRSKEDEAGNSEKSAKKSLREKGKSGRAEEGNEKGTLEERRAEALAKRERVKKGEAKVGDAKKGDVEKGDAKKGASKGGAEAPALPKEPAAQSGRVGVARLLTNSDLNAVLPMKGWVSHGPVPGIPPGEFYNSILYRIPNTSAFAAIQVWDFNAPSMSLEKWSEIQATYPNVELYAEGFTKESLVSLRNQVSTYAFHEPKLAVVVAVSCNSQACDDTAIYRLAELIYGRLPRK